MSRIYCGKGTWENKVRISFDNHKSSLIYIFDTLEEASKFYEDFDFTGKKLSVLKYIKFKFCKHENMYKLDCNSDRYYYKYCPDCNKAEYINTETFEQKVERFDKLNKRIKQDRITELRKDIDLKQQKLEKLTKEYIVEFSEKF
ncbi:hypothetical protein [Lysinibacillus sp. BPa_S21]|uniref:hypothetical protein n=1 Tax=Lysinibacillus sp. BPa_S21 TaxID=2932478 RepID=UPI002012D5DB|nr:hypothetical protein [Lysinibacillus sp. BPa_S21]MCL1696311.1 hypothetical protein [Lysinibacillus sp. BPa_S21]